jgi:5,6,7,8-tetrahydromethanopterin hydro-lyase
MTPPELLDGRVGEAWAGDVPNGSHVNLVIGRRGSPTAAAIAGVLGETVPGHAPFLVCLGAGTEVRPATVVRNKTTVDGDDMLARITWGAAQLGLGQGVMDAVARGTIDAADVDELVLLMVVWVDPEAHDETAVRLANREAAQAAIENAVAGPEDRARYVSRLLEGRDAARNAFYGGD